MSIHWLATRQKVTGLGSQGSGASPTAWDTVDLDTYATLSGNPAACLVRILCATNNMNIGIRKKGSTDVFYGDVATGASTSCMFNIWVGIDTNNEFEIALETVSSPENVLVYIEAWAEDEDCYFPDNAISLGNRTSASTWEPESFTPDGSDSPVLAQMLYSSVGAGTNHDVGIRYTSDTTDTLLGNIQQWGPLIGPIDGSDALDVNASVTGGNFYIMGYFKNGVANSALVDRTPGVTGSDQSMTSPAGGTMGAYNISTTAGGPRAFKIQKVGDADDWLFDTNKMHSSLWVEVDASMEAQVEDSTVTIAEAGYVEDPSSGITGSGTPAAQDAATAGTAERELPGSGVLTAADGATSGTAERVLTCSGTLTPADASVSGTASLQLKLLLTAAEGRELRDEDNAVVANLANIAYEWYDKDTDTTGNPDQSGTFSTNASGEATIQLPSTALASGEFGLLILEHPTDSEIRGIYRIPVT